MSYKLTGNEALGIELGSTRIKAVLIDEQFNPIANGSHTWENRFENGYWTTIQTKYGQVFKRLIRS